MSGSAHCARPLGAWGGGGRRRREKMPLGMATSCRPGSPHPTATRWHRMSHAHAHTHTPHTHTHMHTVRHVYRHRLRYVSYKSAHPDLTCPARPRTVSPLWSQTHSHASQRVTPAVSPGHCQGAYPSVCAGSMCGSPQCGLMEVPQPVTHTTSLPTSPTQAGRGSIPGVCSWGFPEGNSFREVAGLSPLSSAGHSGLRGPLRVRRGPFRVKACCGAIPPLRALE